MLKSVASCCVFYLCQTYLLHFLPLSIENKFIKIPTMGLTRTFCIIELYQEDIALHRSHHHRNVRAVTSDLERVWKNAIIPYTISDSFRGKRNLVICEVSLRRRVYWGGMIGVNPSVCRFSCRSWLELKVIWFPVNKIKIQAKRFEQLFVSHIYRPLIRFSRYR